MLQKIDGTRSAFSADDKEVPVLYYALVFLIVGLVAGVLGATGVAVIASKIAWILWIYFWRIYIIIKRCFWVHLGTALEHFFVMDDEIHGSRI